MKSLLFVPASLCISAAEPVSEPEQAPIMVSTMVVVNDETARKEEAPMRPAKQREAEKAVPGGGDELKLLSNHLAKLGRSLEETRKSVDAMARQRDEARAEAARHQKNHTAAMRELERMRKDLAAARTESTQWKKKAGGLEEKVKAGAMAHAELKKFRGELRGAIEEFQAMKEDIGKARGELADPVERAELKKSMAGMKEERKRLQDEIEMALATRDRVGRDLAGVRKALQAEKETRAARQDELLVRERTVAELEAKLKKSTSASLKSEADAQALRKQMTALHEERTSLSKELAQARSRGQASMTELADARKQLADAESRIGNLERTVTSERRASMEKVKELKAGETAVRDELATLQKASARLEGEWKKAGAACEVAEQEVAEMQESLEQARTEFAIVVKTKKSLEERLSLATLEKQKLGKAARTLQTGMDEAQAGLVQAQTEMQNLRKETEAVRTARNLVTKERDGLQEHLAGKDKEIRDLQTSLKEARSEADKIAKAKSGLENLLLRKAGELRELRAELKELQKSPAQEDPKKPKVPAVIGKAVKVEPDGKE